MKPDEKFNNALDEENKKLEDETWFGTCPGCGLSVSQEHEGKPCPSGCKVRDNRSKKVPFIIERSTVNLRHLGIRSEVADKLKEESGLGV